MGANNQIVSQSNQLTLNSRSKKASLKSVRIPSSYLSKFTRYAETRNTHIISLSDVTIDLIDDVDLMECMAHLMMCPKLYSFTWSSVKVAAKSYFQVWTDPRTPRFSIDYDFYVQHSADFGAIKYALDFARNLRIVDLSEFKLDFKCVSHLMQGMTNNTSIQSLSLIDCNINDESFSCFKQMLQRNSHLRELIMKDNLISNWGMTMIVMALAYNQSLEVLDLRSRYFVIKRKCFTSVFALRYNSTLRYLLLSAWMVNSELCQEMADMLMYNQTIEFINFDDFTFTSEDAQILANSLRNNSSFRLLRLKSTKQYLGYFVIALAYNLSVKTLIFENDNGYSWFEVSTMLQHNSSLEVLYINCASDFGNAFAGLEYNQKVWKIGIMCEPEANHQENSVCRFWRCKTCAFKTGIYRLLVAMCYNSTVRELETQMDAYVPLKLKEILAINRKRFTENSLGEMGSLMMLAAKVYVKTHYLMPASEIIPEEVGEILEEVRDKEYIKRDAEFGTHQLSKMYIFGRKH